MLDFPSLARDQGFPLIESGHHHCHDGWCQTHCPFCSDGTHGWHLGFRLESGTFNCWRCGPHRAFEVVLRLLPGHNKGKTAALLKQYESNQRVKLWKKPQKARARNAIAPAKLLDLSRVHRRYLERRGYDPDELIDTWGLKATKGIAKGGWAWRIVAPVRNAKMEVVGYTGRALHKDRKPRWLTSKDEELTIDPRSLMYGTEFMKDTVLIVEGVSDVWNMGPGTVGTTGIDWTIEQAHILKQATRRFIMFDPEKQAQAQAKKLARWLAAFPGETELITGLDCDPGDLDASTVKEIRKDLRLK